MADKELAELFYLVGKRVRHGYAHRLVPLGLNPGQARALRALADAGQPMRMVRLADELRIVPRSLTPVVDALEAAGLVRRQVDPANRRSTLVVLTGEGARWPIGLARRAGKRGRSCSRCSRPSNARRCASCSNASRAEVRTGRAARAADNARTGAPASG
ncbi:MarR family winged helix-turn-helix transcriptional regulator [Nonomuraea salmonea]|uniref:MarR family winged helix-turn-helix transcriptional regulator n=1 Tax=Nonomuraea salmonea TaxID=46181 RepID=UPI002FED873A